MLVVDANVLIYATNEAAPRHAQARAWLDAALSAREPVGFAWTVLLAYLRLTTKPGLFPRPLPVDRALATVRAWTGAAPSVVLEPTRRHLDVLAGMLAGTGAGGNLTSDAHLAALAVEHDATVVTYDNDFARFSGVRWRAPGSGGRGSDAGR